MDIIEHLIILLIFEACSIKLRLKIRKRMYWSKDRDILCNVAFLKIMLHYHFEIVLHDHKKM